jgi:uncharacterized protein
MNEALRSELFKTLPFFGLFEQLRSAGMHLTLDHYDRLQKSLRRGYGWNSWEDLKSTCAILWVNSSDHYDRAVFEREFDQYQQGVIADMAPKIEYLPDPPINPSPSTDQREWPQVPPRLPLQPALTTSDWQAPIAAKTSALEQNLRKFKPVDLPISQAKMLDSWRTLQGTSPINITDEIDVERTIDQISRRGFLEDVVFRSTGQQKSELIVLVDDGDGMIPYWPALVPLFTAITEHWVTPARLYRFTSYPFKFIYEWQRSTKAVVVDEVLAQCHRTRTTVMMVGDAGAASGASNDDRIQGTANFLERLQTCVQQILWVNPVPSHQWVGTPAAEIQVLMGGKMLELESLNGAQVRMLMRSSQWG